MTHAAADRSTDHAKDRDGRWPRALFIVTVAALIRLAFAAFIPIFPEKNAHNAVESYALNPDGTIATTYRFRDGAFDGPVTAVPNNPRPDDWRAIVITPAPEWSTKPGGVTSPPAV